MTNRDAFVCFAINHFGSGQHPLADARSLAGFRRPYIEECVKAALASGKIAEAAAELGRAILAKPA